MVYFVMQLRNTDKVCYNNRVKVICLVANFFFLYYLVYLNTIDQYVSQQFVAQT